MERQKEKDHEPSSADISHTLDERGRMYSLQQDAVVRTVCSTVNGAIPTGKLRPQNFDEGIAGRFVSIKSKSVQK